MSKPRAYYNEIDKNAVAWLRELIKDGSILDGDVDDRSIVDVAPEDLKGYTQHHFFAGIGGWSHALRLAGWPDDEPIFSGSCPCQPFSSAGKKHGTSDIRHLWPEFRRLIEACRPPVVIGEQVASKLGRDWLSGIDMPPGENRGALDGNTLGLLQSGVRPDLEALGYEVGAVDICAASIGAPHIRQRLYWCGVANTERHGRRTDMQGRGSTGRVTLGRASESSGVAHGDKIRLRECSEQQFLSEQSKQPAPSGEHPCGRGEDGRMADSGEQRRQQKPRSTPGDEETYGGEGRLRVEPHSDNEPASHEQGGGVGDTQLRRPEQCNEEVGPDAQLDQGCLDVWRHSIWHYCFDGKYRRIPAQPEIQLVDDGLPGAEVVRSGYACDEELFPLAPKTEYRVAILKGAGNAIVPPLAAAFIQAVMRSLD